MNFETRADGVLILSPPQQGAPISFFIYPYVEIDGRAVDSKSISPRVDKTLRFADAS